MFDVIFFRWAYIERMMPKLTVLQFKALVSEKPESGLECPFDIMLEIPREMEVLLDGIPNIEL